MSMLRAENVTRPAAEIPLQPASFDIWDKKYRLKAKSGDAGGRRRRRHLAARRARARRRRSHAELREHWYERFLWALRRGAIPAGRITSNAGALRAQAGHLHDQLHRVGHHHAIRWTTSWRRCTRPVSR